MRECCAILLDTCTSLIIKKLFEGKIDKMTIHSSVFHLPFQLRTLLFVFRHTFIVEMVKFYSKHDGCTNRYIIYINNYTNCKTSVIVIWIVCDSLSMRYAGETKT